MMKKKGRLEIYQLILFILALVFLGVMANGLINHGFDPLFKRVEAQYNSVLILLGIDNGVTHGGSGCIHDSGREIDGGRVKGDVSICVDSCTFNLTSPKDLLGASKFMTEGSIFKAWLVNNLKKGPSALGWWADISSWGWGTDSTESQEHKDAFLKLQKVSYEFFKKAGGGESHDKFFAPMEFNSKEVLEYVLREGGVGDVIFRGNSIGWKKEVREGKETPVSAVDAFNEIYKNYKEGGEIFWHYGGEETLSSIPDFNNERSKGKKVLSRDSPIVEEKFTKWFEEAEKNLNKKKVFQENFLNNLDNFLDNNGKGIKVDFGEESPTVKSGWINFGEIRRIPIIYFELKNGKKFGLYYEKGLPFLAYGFADGEFKKSPINDELRYSDADWESFIKINKIYDFLKTEGCGL